MTPETKILITMTALIATAAGCSDRAAPGPHGDPTIAAAAASPVERGRYLVTAMGCNDCHTPWKMGATGPEPDMTRALSGHPADVVLPPPPAPSGPWIGAFSATNTAWSGPWGVSYTANLTPDRETGLGTWSQQMFIDTIRNGRHMGIGRPLLPPMPAAMYAKLTDDDLGAMFAYLHSVPALSNRVPQPQPPAAPPPPAPAPAQVSRN
jgi:hypothetical protein